VGCVQRNIFAGQTLTLPLSINGGIAPFAVAVEWGDDQKNLVTFLDGNEHTLEHTYAIGGYHQIVLNATDSNGDSSHIQTVVSINGTTAATPISGFQKIIDAAQSVWVNAPVPLYVAATTLAVGFWVGDIFQRLTFMHTKPSGRMPKGPRKA